MAKKDSLMYLRMQRYIITTLLSAFSIFLRAYFIYFSNVIDFAGKYKQFAAIELAADNPIYGTILAAHGTLLLFSIIKKWRNLRIYSLCILMALFTLMTVSFFFVQIAGGNNVSWIFGMSYMSMCYFSIKE